MDDVKTWEKTIENEEDVLEDVKENISKLKKSFAELMTLEKDAVVYELKAYLNKEDIDLKIPVFGTKEDACYFLRGEEKKYSRFWEYGQIIHSYVGFIENEKEIVSVYRLRRNFVRDCPQACCYESEHGQDCNCDYAEFDEHISGYYRELGWYLKGIGNALEAVNICEITIGERIENIPKETIQ